MVQGSTVVTKNLRARSVGMCDLLSFFFPLFISDFVNLFIRKKNTCFDPLCLLIHFF